MALSKLDCLARVSIFSHLKMRICEDLQKNALVRNYRSAIMIKKNRK
jgi:hypothetical protein